MEGPSRRGEVSYSARPAAYTTGAASAAGAGASREAKVGAARPSVSASLGDLAARIGTARDVAGSGALAGDRAVLGAALDDAVARVLAGHRAAAARTVDLGIALSRHGDGAIA